MNETHHQLCAALRRYVSGEDPIDDFRVQFAALYFRIREEDRGNAEANALAGKVVGPLAEYSRGHRAEASLRQELTKAVLAVDMIAVVDQVDSAPSSSRVEHNQTHRTLL